VYNLRLPGTDGSSVLDRNVGPVKLADVLSQMFAAEPSTAAGDGHGGDPQRWGPNSWTASTSAMTFSTGVVGNTP
jgi:hypothetical protein